MNEVYLFIRNNWKVLLLAIPVFWFWIVITLAIDDFQDGVDRCVVEQFEKDTVMPRDNLYEYCRAKARTGAE